MLPDVEQTAIQSSKERLPLPGLLRLKLDSCDAIPVAGITLGESDVGDARLHANEVLRSDERLSQLSTSQLETIVQLEMFNLSDLTREPNKEQTARILATSPENLKEVRRKSDSIEKIQEEILEESSDEEKMEKLRELHRRRGELFGYPECDIEFYTEGLNESIEESKQRPEQRAIKQFMGDTWLEMLRDFNDSETSGVLKSVPTMSFYPHKAGCDEAVAQSEKLLSRLGEEATSLYRKELLFNHLEIMKGQLPRRETEEDVWRFFGEMSEIPVGDSDFRELLRRFQGRHFTQNYNLLLETFEN